MSSIASATSRKTPRILLALLAVAVFAGDQVTKMAVERHISEHTVVTVIPGFFNLIKSANTGAAFGLFDQFSASWKVPVLVGVSSVLLITLVGMIWRARRLGWLSSLGFALILGGALSNLFDRVRVGRVVDFLDVYYRSYHWATFNLADSAIVVGAGFLIFQIIFSD